MFSDHVTEPMYVPNCSFDPFMATNGLLGGLVAITASSPLVETEGAFVIGFVSGALVFYGSNTLLKFQARRIV